MYFGDGIEYCVGIAHICEFALIFAIERERERERERIKHGLGKELCLHLVPIFLEPNHNTTLKK
jgi:hypothetical protein